MNYSINYIDLLKNVFWLFKFLFRTYPTIIKIILVISLLSVPISFCEYKTLSILNASLTSLTSGQSLDQTIYSTLIIILLSIFVYLGKYFILLLNGVQLAKVRSKLASFYLKNQINKFKSLEIQSKESDYYISTDYFPAIIVSDFLTPILQLIIAVVIAIGTIIAILFEYSKFSILIGPIIVAVYLMHTFFNRKIYLKLSKVSYHLQKFVKDIDSSFINNFRLIIGESKEENLISSRYKNELRFFLNENQISASRSSSRYLVDTIFVCTTAFLISYSLMSSATLVFLPLMFVACIKLIPMLQIFNIFSTNTLSNYVPLTDAISRLKALDKVKTSKVPIENLKNKFSIINGEISISGKVILEDINLDLRIGDKVLLTGQSGSGKSLLMGVLSGVFSLSKGELLIDKKKLDREADFRKISKEVPQFPVIPEMQTIYEYLTEDIINPDKKTIFKTLKTFNLDQIIERIDKPAGTMKSNLSGGMLQRLAIVRAIISPYKPIVILDECTSALDNKNINIVLEQIFKNFKNCVLVLSSHKEVKNKLINKHLFIKSRKLNTKDLN